MPDEVVRARRPDRAGRHEPRGAPAAHGPRQHLPARAGRRRAGQLLPARQPRRAPRAGAAVGGRPGRGGPPGLHGGPRHRRGVGDARAGGGRRHRRAGRRAARPPGRAHRRAPPRRSDRRARRRRRTACQARAGPALDAAARACSSELGGSYREVVGGRRAGGPRRVRPRARRPPSSCSAPRRRSRWHELLHGSVVGTIVSARPQGFDVHVIAQATSRSSEAAAAAGPAPPTGAAAARPPRRQRRGLGPRRRRPPAAHGRPGCRPRAAHPATDLLLFLVATVVIAAARRRARRRRRRRRGVAARQLVLRASRSTRFTIADPENVVALVDLRGRRAGASVLVDRVAHAQPRGAARPGPRPRRWPAPAASSWASPTRCPSCSTSCARPSSVEARVAAARTATTAGWSMPSAGRRPADRPFDGRALGPGRRRQRPCSCCAAPRSSADDQRVLRTFLSNLALALERAPAPGRGGRGRATWPRPTSCAPRSCKRCRTTCAPRSPRSRRRPPACCSRTWTGTPTSAASSPRPSTRRPTGSTGSSATCST